MTTENRRKEEKEAKTEDSERNSVQHLNSAVVDKAEREESLLPDNQRYIHIPRIEGVVNDYNIQEAMKAVIRNKGAPGVDGITTEEIKGVLQKQWPKIKQEILDGRYRPSPVRRVASPSSGWASKEFKEVDLGDQRLTSRLIKLADRFSALPESPINQACLNWAETKGAYRFFKNEIVSSKAVLNSHSKQTIIRAKQYKTILAIQDF